MLRARICFAGMMISHALSFSLFHSNSLSLLQKKDNVARQRVMHIRKRNTWWQFFTPSKIDLGEIEMPAIWFEHPCNSRQAHLFSDIFNLYPTWNLERGAIKKGREKIIVVCFGKVEKTFFFSQKKTSNIWDWQVFFLLQLMWTQKTLLHFWSSIHKLNFTKMLWHCLLRPDNVWCTYTHTHALSLSLSHTHTLI